MQNIFRYWAIRSGGYLNPGFKTPPVFMKLDSGISWKVNLLGYTYQSGERQINVDLDQRWSQFRVR